ncbi:hypothetical protein PSTT_06611 [Puccinia striiformis]|uniref:Uncharacterized protein n=1 Tax=Puccinia striiformis TaxID=27350 RepID=A0A2S4VJW7_9BASI|nr:hypothetical protein PSTT_06611 [Puccinia striiformis]
MSSFAYRFANGADQVSKGGKQLRRPDDGDHKTTILESTELPIKVINTEIPAAPLRINNSVHFDMLKLPKSQLSGETKTFKEISAGAITFHKAANKHKFFRRTRSSPSPKKCEAKILSHLHDPKYAKTIISMLKEEEGHPSHNTSNKDEHTTPDLPRGVCLRESEADLDSSSIPGKDTMAEVIEVSKVLTMRLTGTPSGAVNLVTGLSLGDVLGAVGQSTEFYDALAIGSKKLIDMSEAHSELIGMVPKDRISIWCYWWGYETAIPLESVDRLTNVKSIETAAIQILVALTAAGGAVELLPFIRFLGAYLDVEWAAITEQNKGKGVVIAATWALPMALVPRPWDFDSPVITTTPPIKNDTPQVIKVLAVSSDNIKFLDSF